MNSVCNTCLWVHVYNDSNFLRLTIFLPSLYPEHWHCGINNAIGNLQDFMNYINRYLGTSSFILFGCIRSSSCRNYIHTYLLIKPHISLLYIYRHAYLLHLCHTQRRLYLYSWWLLRRFLSHWRGCVFIIFHLHGVFIVWWRSKAGGSVQEEIPRLHWMLIRGWVSKIPCALLPKCSWTEIQ